MAPVAGWAPLILNCWPGAFRRWVSPWRDSSSPGVRRDGRSVRLRRGWTKPGLPRWAGSWSKSGRNSRSLPAVGVRVLGWHVVRAPDTNAVAILCLAFPLHLPGQPEKSRLAELLTPRQPRLVVQGSKDSFGTAEELRAAIGKVAGITLVELPGVGHSYRIAKSSAVEPATLHATLVTEVSRFIATTVGITTS